MCGYENEQADGGSSGEAGAAGVHCRAAGRTPLPLLKRFGGYFCHSPLQSRKLHHINLGACALRTH